MGSNNLKQLKKDLKAFAKRVKDFKYTESALITFLLTGMVTLGVSNLTFSAQDEITAQTKQINSSISDIRQQFKRARTENNKLLRDTNLELIQLMEQGDHVVKSPWSSWQFGMNYMYNDWHGHYKGRGDKEEKYPYEGVYQRSANVYERTVSPDSSNYSLLNRNRNPRSATGPAGNYGIASTKPVKEPIVGFEVNAGINPRSINKAPLTLAPPVAVKPDVPKAIEFTPPTPTAPNIQAVNITITDYPLTNYNNGDDLWHLKYGMGSFDPYNGVTGAKNWVVDKSLTKIGDNVNVTDGGTYKLSDGYEKRNNNPTYSNQFALLEYTDTRGLGGSKTEATGSYSSNGTLIVDVTKMRAVTLDPIYLKDYFKTGVNQTRSMSFTNNGTIKLEAAETGGIEVQTEWFEYSGVNNTQDIIVRGINGSSGQIIGNGDKQTALAYTDETNNNDGHQHIYELQNDGTIIMNGKNAKGYGLDVRSGWTAHAINNKTVTLNGDESYGMGLASGKTLGSGSYLSNAAGATINVNGKDSGGIAVLSMIDKVENKGDINVSGDTSFGIYSTINKDIENGGTIKITGNANKSSGLRTGDQNAKLINKGTVTIDSAGSNNIGLLSTEGSVK